MASLHEVQAQRCGSADEIGVICKRDLCFLASLAPSVFLILVSEKADGGSQSVSLSQRCYYLVLFQSSSVKLITRAGGVELTLYLTLSRLLQRLLKQDFSGEFRKPPVAIPDLDACHYLITTRSGDGCGLLGNL